MGILIPMATLRSKQYIKFTLYFTCFHGEVQCKSVVRNAHGSRTGNERFMNELCERGLNELNAKILRDPQ